MIVRFRLLLALGLALSMGTPASASNDQFWSRQWGMQKIGAEVAWATGTGEGVTIGIVDTGIDLNHTDLAEKILAGMDYVDGDDRAQDGHGHGTHVAGIAAALTNNQLGVAGVAPGARLLPVRVFDDEGDAREGYDVAIKWATDHGAQVINLSAGTLTQGLGMDEILFGPDFVESLRYAWSKKVIVVVAAGNDFLLQSGYSSDDPALVVSATDRNDGKPDFSSGVGDAKWAIAAPGGGSTTDPAEADVYSTYKGNSYRYLAGTSMAAPHVTGAAAVLRSLGLSPQETIDRLLATAKDLGPQGRDSTFGAGRLDLARAVQGLTPVSSGGSGAGGGQPGTGGAGSGGGGSGGTSGAGGTKQTPGPAAGSLTTEPGGTQGSGATEGEDGEASEEGESGGNALLNLVIAALLAAGIAGAIVWSRIRGRAYREI